MLGPHAVDALQVQQTGSIVMWYPYATMYTVDSVQIVLTDSSGELIPARGVTTHAGHEADLSGGGFCGSYITTLRANHN